MVTYLLFFRVSCSANVPTVHVYEAVIVGLLNAHENCCSIMLEVFFLVLPIMYHDECNNSFIIGVLRIKAITILLLILLVVQ